MKKIILFASAALLLAACTSSSDEVKKFAVDFATKVSHNQLDSVRMMYPDAAKCDSLALSFAEDSVKVTETETKGTFSVDFGGGVNAIIVRSEDGKMTVKSSKGLLAYPEEQVKFALGTGWITPELDDLQRQERFADTGFLEQLSKGFLSDLKKQIVIAGISDNRTDYASDWTYGGDFFVSVKNNSQYDINAEDYQVTVYSRIRKKSRVYTSKDIYAGSSVTLDGIFLEYEDYYNWDVEPSFSITLKMTDAEALAKYYVPTGNEYKNYLDGKVNSGNGTNNQAKPAAKGVAQETQYDWLSTRYATYDDIKNMDKGQIRVLKNAIFARHGRRFKDPNLRAYFNSQSWYNPTRDEVPPKEFNKFENYNIKFLLKYE